MKILITGGAGYIGSELVKLLSGIEQVQEIRVYDNLNRNNYNSFLGCKLTQYEKVKFVHGDILDSRSLKMALKDIDIVYHMAAMVTTPFANTDPHFFEQVNHWGTAELTYAIDESDVKKLIYVSSVSVYGASGKEVTEDTIPNPRTFYGISKLRGEEHIARMSDKVNTLIIRSGNVYGYSDSMRFDAVINKFAFDTNFSKRISINGNGRQKRAFIHIDSITNLLGQLTIKEVPSGIYNLVERNLEVLDIVDTFKALIPELEFIFINQHLELREVSVNTQLKIKSYIDIPDTCDFQNEIKEFLSHFAY